ncbi:MAG TPA: DUF4349 domain-containing protein [Candidatus Limnocylindrales bacterium]|nr:DUF4349 domain-containing protein [Candidatus Limnocylindrales bacterium]
MSTRTVHLPRRFRLLSLIGVALFVAACAAGASTAGPARGPEAVPGVSTTDSSSGQGGGEVAPAASPPSADFGSNGAPQLNDINIPALLIIKTGTMDLQVATLDDALNAASQKITALGGYASGSSRQGDGDQQTASVTYRIPAQSWDAALVALRGLATKVLSEQSGTQDVTGEVVDLQARITNLQATEQALQAIMAKATKISDVLAVEQQLSDVRGQIEQMTGERNHLQEQAAYSTLTVNFSLKPQAVVAQTRQFDPNAEVDRASASLVDVLQAVATAGIWFGIVWLPILVAVLIVTGIVIFVLRRIARSKPTDHPDLGEPPAGDALAPGAQA